MARVARVLLVDSDRALRLALAEALVKAGHEVEAVSAIGFALDSLRSHKADVVITDTMNAAFIGARSLILVTSSDGSENTRVAAFEAGADDFVARPLSVREMVLRVQALLRRRKRATEVADVWGDPALSVRVVDTSIRRLRAKLGPARDLLRTLRNVGYQLRAE